MEADAIKRLFSSYYQMSKVCAEEVMRRLKDEEQSECLDKLEEAVRQVSEYENETRKDAITFDAMENDASQSDVSEWGDLTQRFYEKHSQMKNVSYSGGLTDFQSHIQQLQENLELDDMIVASSDSNIDPYSKKPIQHPVKTKFCNHVFDKTTVMEILATKGKNGRLRCPYMGCLKHFTAQDLIEMVKEDYKEEPSDCENM